MSDYQAFKLILIKFFSLDAKDVIHVYLGFLFFFIAILIFKKPITSYKLLIVGLINTNFLPFLIILFARLGLIKK